MSSFYPYSIGIITSLGVPDNSYTDLNLRVYPFTTRSYTQVSKTNGRYFFGSAGTPMVSGYYQLYDGSAAAGSPLTTAQFIIGEPEAVIITGSQTIAGVKTFSNQPILNAGVQTDTISEKTSNTGVTIDGVLIKDSLDGSSIVAKTGTQTVAGDKTFSGQSVLHFNANGNCSMAGYTLSGLIAPDGSVGSAAIPLSYLNSRLSALQTPNSRVIEVNPEVAANIAGEVYQSIYEAVQYAVSQTPVITKQFTILVRSMYNGSSLIALGGSISQYVHIVAVGQHIGIVFGDGSLSLAKPMNIENATCYFGNNDVITDRTYENVNFKNCLIYHYRDIFFNSGDLENCRIIGTGSTKLTYGGITNLINCTFRNEPVKLAGHSGCELGLQSFGNFTVVADPSVAP